MNFERAKNEIVCIVNAVWLSGAAAGAAAATEAMECVHYYGPIEVCCCSSICQVLLSTRESNCSLLLFVLYYIISSLFGNINLLWSVLRHYTYIYCVRDAVDSPCLFHLLT